MIILIYHTWQCITTSHLTCWCKMNNGPCNLVEMSFFIWCRNESLHFIWFHLERRKLVWNYHQTNHLTSQSTVIFEKLTVVLNLTAFYPVHENLSLICILSHMNPVQTFLSCLFKVCFNTLWFMPRCSRCFMPCPFLPSWFDHSLPSGKEYASWTIWLCSFLQPRIMYTQCSSNSLQSILFFSTLPLYLKYLAKCGAFWNGN
jgi:hypothetical protein